MMIKLTIVEDERKIRVELANFFTHYGYHVKCVTHFARVAEEVLAEAPDILLLDINLPYYDGFYVCRAIRKQSRMGIIVVTSRDTEMDELMSMNLGADDFVTKPFNTQILLARVAALAARIGNPHAANRSYGNFSLDAATMVLTCGDRTCDLSKNEFRILALLLRECGRIVTREQLMDDLWNNHEFLDDNTLTVNVNRLRRKMKAVGAVPEIRTKRGVGYLL
ncbi:MAG: response regulator transcription factor [Sporolactobacillus sp.]|jgi:DNA-binding response OmpR family regulator|nr:response regulator transcription factor [Sporolactobacillus sp.]